MARDWFRRTTWTSEDERELHARLERARPANGAQYLRIQAAYLADAEPPHPEAALALLGRILTDFPESREVPAACEQMGQCLEALGRIDEARDAYWQAVIGMRRMPQVGNRAWSEYPRVVAEFRIEDHYQQALDVLDEFGGERMFPVDHFEWHASRAIIFDHRGERLAATEEARAALAAAERDHSGFRYHPKVGLVGRRYARTRAALERLAGRSRSWTQRLAAWLH